GRPGRHLGAPPGASPGRGAAGRSAAGRGVLLDRAGPGGRGGAAAAGQGVPGPGAATAGDGRGAHHGAPPDHRPALRPGRRGRTASAARTAAGDRAGRRSGRPAGPDADVAAERGVLPATGARAGVARLAAGARGGTGTGPAGLAGEAGDRCDERAAGGRGRLTGCRLDSARRAGVLPLDGWGGQSVGGPLNIAARAPGMVVSSSRACCTYLCSHSSSYWVATVWVTEVKSRRPPVIW